MYKFYFQAIDTIVVPAGGTGAMFPGSYMFELLGKVDITPSKKNVIVELLEKLVRIHILYICTDAGGSSLNRQALLNI